MATAATRSLSEIRKALRQGDSATAQNLLDSFTASLEKSGLPSAERPAVEAALTELRAMSEAALAGTRAAVEHIQAIFDCARSLQTYDQAGQRRSTSIQAATARRY
ncbi:hypothetical protein MLD63_02085 (plasmid) [Paracoccus sp. TK19116]|uniref:Uncharacterized protein n=1 Tax=Paracoccus albicereus TaxID=2922394 RepID=A0ABT1MQM0_9RHOB|nr:hypothetical protein [Paracoccus albicereus]MCQ0969226.1 hypothetical protein [Paracoccus albicereus]